jgi:hypothetical protein
VQWNAPTEVADAINFATKEISSEVLATKMNQVAGKASSGSDLGLWLKLEKAN